MRFILRGKAIDLTISDVHKVGEKISPEVNDGCKVNF